jgi:uncharacterized protein
MTNFTETTSPRPDRDLTLLVWDAPNIDMTITGLIGGRRRPTRAERPDSDKLMEWLVCTYTNVIDATVFVNVPPGRPVVALEGWFNQLRYSGFGVYPKPKRNETDDVDEVMVAHIEQAHATGQLDRLLLMSHDRKRFVPLAEKLLDDGIEVSPIVLRDLDRWPEGCTPIHLYDLPEVVADRAAGAVNLRDLPDDGQLLQATRTPASIRQQLRAGAAA